MKDPYFLDWQTMKIYLKNIVLLFFFAIILFFQTVSWGSDMALIELSRNGTVEITSKSGNSKGTGFFISDLYVATCFHVISQTSVQGGVENVNIFTDITIKTNSGEILTASCVSTPSQTDPSPLQYDFAILKISTKPKQSISILKFAEDEHLLKVGSDVLFSGYPLASPAMITHKGMISGIDAIDSIICIQSPINKGNSGGALLSSDGNVLGIISMREGGISKGLQDLSEHIEITSSQGSVHIKGVDPLQSIHAIIATLDTYISTGIGYAINIKFMRDYLKKHPEILK